MAGGQAPPAAAATRPPDMLVSLAEDYGVYGWFSEGFDTLDLREAKALLGGSVAVSSTQITCCSQSQMPMRNACSHLDLFAVHHASDRRPFDHPVLECRVVLELSHRELAAHTPRVEDEAIGIEHGVAIGEPFAFR
jgi:hypothetical protein